MTEKPKEKRCQAINHPHVAPGWGCCHCRSYNGDWRVVCKMPDCGHRRCDHDAKNKPS